METGHASKRYIEVIVSPCRWDGESFRLCGDRIHESKHVSPKEALALALSLRGERRSVIIRPSFNEVIDGVPGYREWRSFDGSLFKEVRFGKNATSKEVDDGDIVLPACIEEDPNTYGLPVWTITSMMLCKEDGLGIDGVAGAWWFECGTKEGVTIIVGESWGGDAVRKAEVRVSGEGRETRKYHGEAAADRVVWFRKLWKELCVEAGKDPEQEHWFVMEQNDQSREPERDEDHERAHGSPP